MADYKIVDSINLICLLAMHGVKPIEIRGNGRFNSAVYLEDVDFSNVKAEWDAGEWNELKLFAKQFKKVKKMLVTKDIDCLNC